MTERLCNYRIKVIRDKIIILDFNTSYKQPYERYEAEIKIVFEKND